MSLRFTLAAAIVSVSLGAVASSNLITGDGGRAGTPADLSKFNMARVIYDSEGGMGPPAAPSRCRCRPTSGPARGSLPWPTR